MFLYIYCVYFGNENTRPTLSKGKFVDYFEKVKKMKLKIIYTSF